VVKKTIMAATVGKNMVSHGKSKPKSKYENAKKYQT